MFVSFSSSVILSVAAFVSTAVNAENEDKIIMKDNNIAVSLFSFVLTVNIAPYMICLYIKSGYHLIANSVRLNCMYYDLCKKNVYPIFLYTVVVNAHIFYHDFE